MKVLSMKLTFKDDMLVNVEDSMSAGHELSLLPSKLMVDEYKVQHRNASWLIDRTRVD